MIGPPVTIAWTSAEAVLFGPESRLVRLPLAEEDDRAAMILETWRTEFPEIGRAQLLAGSDAGVAPEAARLAQLAADAGLKLEIAPPPGELRSGRRNGWNALRGRMLRPRVAAAGALVLAAAAAGGWQWSQARERERLSQLTAAERESELRRAESAETGRRREASTEQARALLAVCAVPRQFAAEWLAAVAAAVPPSVVIDAIEIIGARCRVAGHTVPGPAGVETAVEGLRQAVFPAAAGWTMENASPGRLASAVTAAPSSDSSFFVQPASPAPFEPSYAAPSRLSSAAPLGSRSPAGGGSSAAPVAASGVSVSSLSGAPANARPAAPPGFSAPPNVSSAASSPAAAVSLPAAGSGASAASPGFSPASVASSRTGTRFLGDASSGFTRPQVSAPAVSFAPNPAAASPSAIAAPYAIISAFRLEAVATAPAGTLQTDARPDVAAAAYARLPDKIAVESLLAEISRAWRIDAGGVEAAQGVERRRYALTALTRDPRVWTDVLQLTHQLNAIAGIAIDSMTLAASPGEGGGLAKAALDVSIRLRTNHSAAAR